MPRNKQPKPPKKNEARRPTYANEESLQRRLNCKPVLEAVDKQLPPKSSMKPGTAAPRDVRRYQQLQDMMPVLGDVQQQLWPHRVPLPLTTLPSICAHMAIRAICPKWQKLMGGRGAGQTHTECRGPLADWDVQPWLRGTGSLLRGQPHQPAEAVWHTAVADG